MNITDFINITNGCGKFEGESGNANWFWDAVMNGDGEDFQPLGEDGIIYSLFVVDSAEADAFKMTIGDAVIVFEDSQGFVSLLEFKTRPAAEHFIAKHSGTD